MAESKEELKSLLIKVKGENEKAGSKLNIQNTKVMASGPITSWRIDGGKVETLTDFLFLGSKISVDGDGSHEIKGCLLGFPGSSVVKNLPAKAGDTGSISGLGDPLEEEMTTHCSILA